MVSRWVMGARVLFCILLAIIFYLAMTSRPMPALVVSFGDKVNHIGAFAVLTVFAALGRLKRVWRVGLLSGYALGIELFQSMTTHRSAEWLDLLADVIGMTLGELFVFIIVMIYTRRTKEI